MSSPAPENPYQPPATDLTVPPAATPAPVQEMVLKDPRTRGWAAISFIELVSLLTVARFLGPETASVGAFLQIAIGVTFFCAIIAYLPWVYLVATNARKMDRHSGVKPGWAVGCYFIPFIGWVMPALTMKEIVDTTFRHGQAKGIGFLIAIWWVAYLGMNVSWRIDPTSGVALGTTCVAGLSISILIARISARQAGFRWSDFPDHQRPSMTPVGGSPRPVAATRLPSPRPAGVPASRPRPGRPSATGGEGQDVP